MYTISINELKSLHAPHVQIESLEGGIYIAYTDINNTRTLIFDGGKALRAHSLELMRSQLVHLDNATFELVMTTPYDEMIGSPESTARPASMRLPQQELTNV